MATFYVTQSGTGNGDTYLTAMSVAAHNANTYSITAGDTVYLCDTITSRIVPPISGTSGHVITYKGDYAGHAALIQVTGESQLRFDGIDYLTFDGIKFDGQNESAEIGLFSEGQSEHITVINCWFEEQQRKGIAMWNDGRYYNGAGDPGPCRYWTVGGSPGNGNTFYNVGISTAANIMSVWYSNNLVFSYNTIYSDKPPFGLGRSGLVIEDSDHVLVEYNNFYNLTNEDGIGGKNASYVIVRYNTSHDMQGGSGDINSQGTGINMAFSINPVRPCHNWYVYGNTSYNNNKVGILVMYGATNINIWSNVIYSNGLAGIDVVQSSDATTIKIYNNTIVNSGELWGLAMASNIYIAAAASALIKNNILYSSVKQNQITIGATSGVTMDYNHYYWTGGTPTVNWGGTVYNYNALPGTQEDHASTGNPNFVNAGSNNYKLLSTSPCKDTGVDLSGLAGSVTIQGATGYPGTVNMYWDDALDPNNTDFSTTPPTVAMVDQDTYENWEKGAYVYTDSINFPNGVINTPSSNQQIYEGESVNFSGTASLGTPPYTYLWDFNGGATNSTNEDPGNITFNIAGVYTIQFIVTDDEDVTDSTPDTVEITVYGTGNNFSGDSNCVAVWRFEDSPGFGIDSQGSNDLTNVGADEENTYYKEGSQSASFNRAISDRMTITDANQDAGFPWRYDDGESIVKDFSICGWFRLKTVPYDYSSSYYIFSKYSLSSARVFGIWIADTDNKIKLAMGWNNGETYEEAPFGTACVINRWYHFGITYDSATKFGRIRMWDDTAQALLDSDKTNTYANATDACDVGLTIGTRDDAGRPFDGYIDELVVFNRVITIDEIDDIRNQIYSTGWSYTINGITSFSKINGILISNIKYINSV